MATWRMSTVDPAYPKVISIAQSKNTGQYMLAIVTANAADTTDAPGRVFKSNNYGTTWTMLEDLFPNNGIDTSHLNYATLASGTYHYQTKVFYACAVSDDGKYQSFGQKPYDYNGIWYSTNYGNTTGTADEKWKYISFSTVVANGAFPGGTQQMMYSPGPYPVYFSDYVYLRSSTHVTGLTPATGSTNELGVTIGTYFTSTVPSLYDNNFTTITRRLVYYISGGNLYKNTNGGTGVLINPSSWPVSNTPGGGVAVSTLGTIVVAARYVTSTGGLWVSDDGGSNWTQKLVNVNLNTVDMSKDGKYIITGPMGQGTCRFYLSQDFGETWTTQDLAITGDLLKLYITNDGKRVVGAGLKSSNPAYFIPTTTGYVTYIGPMTAAEQRVTGKTVAELLALSYTINDIIGAGYSQNELIAGGIVPDWDYYPDANRLKQSYVKDFIDISGSLLLRNNANLYVHGNTTVNGKLLLNNSIMQTDLSFNKRIFVGSDISMAGNVTIASDVSLNGLVTGCLFPDNSIPTTAFVGTVIAAGPDYAKASVIYQGKFRADGDVSMNGTNVQAKNITVNGNIEFNDGTKMSTYDNNISISGIELPYSNAYTCTNIASSYVQNVGRGLVASNDGKYLLSIYGINDGQTTYPSGNAGLAGLFLSSDYGQSFTLVTLPTVAAYTHPTNSAYNMAANNLTKVSYVVAEMSPSGKHMLCSLTGTGTRANWKDSVVAYSSNYGSNWSTKFAWDFLKIPAYIGLYDVLVNAFAISDDASIVIANASTTASQIAQAGTGTYISTNSMVSFTKYEPTASSANKILLIANNTRMLTSVGDQIRVYDLSGNVVYGSPTPPQFMNYSTSHNGNITIEGWAWSQSAKKLNIITTSDFINFTKTDLLTNNNTILPGIWSNPYTTLMYPLTNPDGGISGVVSPSGKYIIIGFTEYGSTATHPDIFVKDLYYSNNYGKNSAGDAYAFTKISPIYPLTGNYRSHSAVMSDSGFLFVKYTSTYGNNILRLDFRKFKASTFSGLTIKNTLTAPTYVVSSDYRIKNNVAKLDNVFTVDNLRPVKYFQTLINRQQYGLIAHELQQYYPDLVIGEKDGPNLQHVNYTGLIAILINEIIRLKREFTELEKKRQITI
jgi:hypothetical protein